MDDRFRWDCYDAKGSPANSLHELREVGRAPPELVDEVLRGLVYRHELRLLRLPLRIREGTNHDICRHWIRVCVDRFRRHGARASHGRRGQAACRTSLLQDLRAGPVIYTPAQIVIWQLPVLRAGGKASAAVNVLSRQRRAGTRARPCRVTGGRADASLPPRPWRGARPASAP